MFTVMYRVPNIKYGSDSETAVSFSVKKLAAFYEFVMLKIACELDEDSRGIIGAIPWVLKLKWENDIRTQCESTVLVPHTIICPIFLHFMVIKPIESAISRVLESTELLYLICLERACRLNAIVWDQTDSIWCYFA